MTEPLHDVSTGEVREVPIGEVGDLLATGQYKPAPGARVPVVVGDGSVQTIAAKDLPAALDQGWTVAGSEDVKRFRDAQHYETVGAQTRAAGEAALRGLTLGLSDAAMRKLGVDAEGLSKRKELNPVLSGGLELAGAAAPLLLSGGASAPESAAGLAASAVRTAGVLPRAVVAGGRAIEGGLRSILGESVLARGAAGLTAGAAEGGLYGLGQAVSESALKDVPLTAERIAAHVGAGALFGGATGGVLGSTAASVEKLLVPKIKELFSVENVQRFVDRAGLRQWAQGRGKALFGKLRRDFGDDAEAVIGRTVRDEGLDQVISSGSTWDEIHSATREKVGVAGRKIGEDLRAIDEAMPDAAAPAAERIAARAERELLEPLQKTGIASDKGLARKVKREFQAIWPEVEAVGPLAENATAEEIAAHQAAAVEQARGELVPTFEALHKLRARIDDLAFPKGMADATPYQKALQKLRGIVEDEITTGADAAAERMGGISAETYSADKLRYKALLWLDKAAESNAASELANRTVSLTDNIWGSAITAGTLTRLLAGDVGALGAMAISTMAGAGAASLNKYLREQGQGLAARTGEKILGLMRASESTAREADRAVGSFFRTADATAHVAPLVAVEAGDRAALQPLRARYEQKQEQLQRFVAAPESKLGRALGDTDQTAPAVAQELRAVAMRGAQFLLSKSPKKRTRTSDLYAHLDKRQRVSDSDMARFLRYSAAVDNPRQVIRDFAKGKITREGAETLRVVYPRLHAHLADGVQQRLLKSKEALPRQRLVQLSLLLGKPLHPSMEPGFIAMCQQVHAASRQQAQGAQPPSQRRAPNVAQQYATSSQQLEARP